VVHLYTSGKYIERDSNEWSLVRDVNVFLDLHGFSVSEQAVRLKKEFSFGRKFLYPVLRIKVDVYVVSFISSNVGRIAPEVGRWVLI